MNLKMLYSYFIEDKCVMHKHSSELQYLFDVDASFIISFTNHIKIDNLIIKNKYCLSKTMWVVNRLNKIYTKHDIVDEIYKFCISNNFNKFLILDSNFISNDSDLINKSYDISSYILKNNEIYTLYNNYKLLLPFFITSNIDLIKCSSIYNIAPTKDTTINDCWPTPWPKLQGCKNNDVSSKVSKDTTINDCWPTPWPKLQGCKNNDVSSKVSKFIFIEQINTIVYSKNNKLHDTSLLNTLIKIISYTPYKSLMKLHVFKFFRYYILYSKINILKYLLLTIFIKLCYYAT